MESCPGSHNFISQSLFEYTHLTKSLFRKGLAYFMLFPYLPALICINANWGHVWGRFHFFHIPMPPKITQGVKP